MKFIPITIRLAGELQRDTAKAKLDNLPVGKNLEVVFRETPKARTPDQNSAMWSGPLRDIAEQAWLQKRQFSAEAWHFFFKSEYLPEDDDPELARKVKNPEQYKKWELTPNGDRILKGSTTQLTPYGFGLHMEQVQAFGADLGVHFSARPQQ